VTDSDLFFSFGGTQGVEITGQAINNTGTYEGSITYLILDTYGYNTLPTGIPFFNDFRPDMNYLQTHCSAEASGVGPHWFISAVTVTVPIH
jgi:hypothetical protein